MLLLASSVCGLFKWRQFEPEVILLAVGWYLRSRRGGVARRARPARRSRHGARTAGPIAVSLYFGPIEFSHGLSRFRNDGRHLLAAVRECTCPNLITSARSHND